MKPIVYTEEQAAKKMLVSGPTLSRWRRGGYIRHYRQLGRLIRYTPEDIEKNLEERASMRPKPANERPVTEARFGS